MKKIAKFYDFEKGLDKQALTAVLHDASGKSSVLNYEEARGLYNDLVTGKVKAEPTPEEKPVEKIVYVEKPEPQKETCDVIVKANPVEVPDDTECYEVKAGDNWSNVVAAKYGAYGKDNAAIVRQLKDAYYEANKEELQAQGIKSSYGAFFPKAKDKLCIPQTVNVNGKEYNYNKETDTKADIVSKDYKGATLKSKSNPFTKEQYQAETCTGTIKADTQEELNKKVQAYKEEQDRR